MAKFVPAPPSIAISAPSRGPSDIDEETSQLETLTTHSTTNISMESGASSMSIEPTYRMDPVQCFKENTIYKMIDDLIYEEMSDKRYDAKLCKEMAQDLAAKIMDKVKALEIRRYKYVVTVSIGSVQGDPPGLRMCSRCLWNKNTDSSVTVNYMNPSLYVVVIIYGLFVE